MRSALISLVMATLTALPAAAQSAGTERPVLLELFVSQNCGACITANAALAELAAHSETNVLPLTYGVDYWDYLGWRDTMAQPDFADRQRDYADRFEQARVYTPQIIVDGREAGPGGDGVRIADDIEICRKIADRAPGLTARREGAELSIRVAAGPAPDTDAVIWLVGYEPGSIAVDVGAGENRGRKFTVLNPVREMRRVGTWSGAETQLRIPAPRTGAYAVLVQEADSGPILAVADGR